MKISGWSEGLWWNRTTIEKAETTASPKFALQDRKTLDGVLRVEREQGTEPSKYLGIAGKNTVSEMLERVDLRVRIATEKIWMNCTVRALPRWSPTRVLDTPMVA